MSLSYAPGLPGTGAEPVSAAAALASGQIVISIETDMNRLEGAWRSLERAAPAHVYQSFDWIALWTRTIGADAGIEPCFVVGRFQDGRPAFLLPLGMRRQMGANVLVWLGGDEADLKCGLYDAKFLLTLDAKGWTGFWTRICARLPRIDAICFSDQPERLGSFPNPFLTSKTHVQADGTHAARLGDDWESYYRAKRNSAARQLDRRRMRNLQAAGTVRFEIAKDTNAALAMTERLLWEKARALTRQGIADPFADASVRNYYEIQTRAMYPAGNTHVSALTVNGEPVSIVWGLIFEKRFYYLVVAYDPQHSNGAPGRLHLNELFRWAIENGLEYVDLGVGDQDFKFNWCEEHVALFATVRACSLRGIAFTLAQGVKTWSKRCIKTSPRLWTWAKQIRALRSSTRAART